MEQDGGDHHRAAHGHSLEGETAAEPPQGEHQQTELEHMREDRQRRSLAGRRRPEEPADHEGPHEQVCEHQPARDRHARRELDAAVRAQPALTALLQQDMHEAATLAGSVQQLSLSLTNA